MSILVTGGTGYIGSHTCVELLNAGEKIIVIDNFSNSKPDMIDKIKHISGKDFKFYEVDLLDRQGLIKVFEENPDIDSVIHFAGYKAVGESVSQPIKYYYNNVTGSLILLEVMKQFNCKKIVFSSSATVYGSPAVRKYTENMEFGKTTNPYGTTKLMIEQILQDLYISDNDWAISILRYFNPIGAHESGLIGDNPNGIPNNLMPFIQKVASGKLEQLSIFGDDYDTKDGTGARDYIHVVDLSIGHLKALEKISKEGKGLYIYNLGTGNPYTVLEIVKTFEKVNNMKLNYKIVDRRPGDLPEYYADPTKAKDELGWVATRTIEEMCKDSWNFAKNNM